MKGSNYLAPITEIVMDGTVYQLRFDLNCFRIAEDIYADEYQKEKNFAEIALELTRGRLSAIMAVFYAAIRSAGNALSWQAFCGTFKLTDIPGVKDALIQAVADALPEPDAPVAPAAPEKGQDPTNGKPESQPTSPGTGSGTEA